MVTINQLREAYTAAAANGQNIEQLAETLGIKVASLQQNLTSARRDLRQIGTTEEELKAIFPPLKRRSGPRTSKRAEALIAMRDEARKAAEAKAAADAAKDAADEKALLDLMDSMNPENAATPAEPTDSELEALTAP